MACMYNREKNNTSTTIYPKCHNTDRKECLVTIPFSSFLLLSSSSYLFFLSSFSSGHSFTHIHGSYLLPRTTCMLAIVRDDSHVHQAELKKRRMKEEEKKWAVFPILGTLLSVLSLARFLSRLVPDCPNVMYKEYPYAPCRAQHHGYEDGRIV